MDSFQPPGGQSEEEEELSQDVGGAEGFGAGPVAEGGGSTFSPTVCGGSIRGGSFATGISCDGASVGSLGETGTDGVAAAAESSLVFSSASLNKQHTYITVPHKRTTGLIVYRFFISSP